MSDYVIPEKEDIYKLESSPVHNHKLIKVILTVVLVSLMLVNLVGFSVVLAESDFRKFRELFQDKVVHIELYKDNNYDRFESKNFYFYEDIIFNYGEYMARVGDSFVVAGISPSLLKFLDYQNFEVKDGLVFVKSKSDIEIKTHDYKIEMPINSSIILDVQNTSVYVVSGEILFEDKIIYQNQRVIFGNINFTVQSVGDISTLNVEAVQTLLSLAEKIEI